MLASLQLPLKRNATTENMQDDDYSLNRSVSDFFEEAIGLGLADEIRHSQEDRYLPGKELAKGGMKSITNSVDTVTGREIAKAQLIQSDDPEHIERFFHEARICASLEHPNIVPVYDAGYDRDGLPFFTMRLLGGQTLQKKVLSEPADTAELIDAFVKICDAVSYAHSQRVIHRDLKPDNIQIGDFGEVQVCDWGLACRDGYQDPQTSHESITQEFVIPVTLDGLIKGTPGYLAPEQASFEKPEPTAQVDVYALGAILYFILTGRAPLEGENTQQSIQKTRSGDIPTIKSLAPDTANSLVAICDKAMALAPEDRYQSVLELKNDILKYQHGFPTAAEDAGAWSALQLFIKRNLRITVMASAFFVLFNAALVIFFANLSEKEQQAREAELEATRAAEIAQISELEALEAMSKLALSEQAARQALENLQSMTLRRDIAAQKAAPRYLRIAKVDRNRFAHHEGLKNVNQALELNPNEIDAKETKGKLLFALLRYREARQYLANSTSIHGALVPIIDQMIHLKDEPMLSKYDELIHLFRLHHKYNLGRVYFEELVYSPSLDFLSTTERRALAADVYRIFSGEQNQATFEELQSEIQAHRPELLYKTGISTFDLRKHPKTKTHMIRGAETRQVILPEVLLTGLLIDDLNACPNLEEVYFSTPLI